MSRPPSPAPLPEDFRGRRPALACDRCRKRKVKCDRRLPCSSCARHGRADQCSYELSPGNREGISQAEELRRLQLENQRLRSELDVSNNRLSLLRHPSHAPNMESAAVNHFLFRFGATCGSSRGWFESVVPLAMQAGGLLGDALGACSLALVGSDEKNADYSSRGHALYSQTLVSLRQALYSERAAESHILHATMLLVFYELVVLQDPVSWLVHVDGVGRLIAFRGPEMHTATLELETFRLFRVFGVASSIFARKPSFLAEPAWKVLPWTQSYPSKDILDLMVDHLVEIPGFIAAADRLRREGLSDEDRVAMTIGLADSLREFGEGVMVWRNTWLLTHPALPPGLPLDTPDQILEQYLTASPVLVAAFTLYLTTQLLMLRADPSVAGQLSRPPPELVESICNVCEAQMASKMMDYITALRMLFPLRVAYYTPDTPSIHAVRIDGLFEMLRQQYGVLLAREMHSAPLPQFGGRLDLGAFSTSLEGTYDSTFLDGVDSPTSPI